MHWACFIFIYLLQLKMPASVCDHLVLLPSTFLIVVEHIFSDVLPLAVVCRHVVNTLLEALVSSPTGVEKQPQHQHWGVSESVLAQQGALSHNYNGFSSRKSTSLGVNKIDNVSRKLWCKCKNFSKYHACVTMIIHIFSSNIIKHLTLFEINYKYGIHNIDLSWKTY